MPQENFWIRETIIHLRNDNRESKLKRERGRDDAVRATIDVRTTWTGARYLRPFSLPVPALTDCHRHHWAEYQPRVLITTLHFFYTSFQPEQATVLPSTQTICYSFKLGCISELSMMGLKMTSKSRLISHREWPKHVLLWEGWGEKKKKKSEPIQFMISLFLANGGGNFFRVSSQHFLLVVCRASCRATFQK